MSNIEKREDGWYADGSGPFGSRQAARDALRNPAEDTDAAGLVETARTEFQAVSEPLVPAGDNVEGFEQEERELTDGTVERVSLTVSPEAQAVIDREAEKITRRRDNFLHMATSTTGPAQRYWIKKVQEEGYASYLSEEFIASVTQATEDAQV